MKCYHKPGIIPQWWVLWPLFYWENVKGLGHGFSEKMFLIPHSARPKPKLFLPYVDDTFIILVTWLRKPWWFPLWILTAENLWKRKHPNHYLSLMYSVLLHTKCIHVGNQPTQTTWCNLLHGHFTLIQCPNSAYIDDLLFKPSNRHRKLHSDHSNLIKL